ncbi:uncharacterized protein [Centruroides vittatus]|uniref:uncharacterized protein n=1 Tax=Centruroides vittatus TaxID=120091 RepID=UPI00350ECEF8
MAMSRKWASVLLICSTSMTKPYGLLLTVCTKAAISGSVFHKMNSEDYRVKYLPDILLYKRYVDDVLILWKTEPDIAAFVQTVNNNPYGLVIEVEQISSTEAHFLDIAIRIEASTIQTSVYRKPTATPIYIPKGSCDPFSYKAAAFKTLVRRATSYSSTKKALDKELAYLKKVATDHGYPSLIRRITRQHHQGSTSAGQANGSANKKNLTRLPITYNPYVCKVYGEIAKKQQMQIAYRRGPTIAEILKNCKDPPDPNRMYGVYSIPLRDNRWQRELVYIGSTKRSLKTRLKEHQADLQHRKLNTALSIYASDQDINAELDKAKIIVTTPHPEHIKWLEAVAIYKTSCNNICINQKEEINISSAWQILLDTHKR